MSSVRPNGHVNGVPTDDNWSSLENKSENVALFQTINGEIDDFVSEWCSRNKNKSIANELNERYD